MRRTLSAACILLSVTLTVSAQNAADVIGAERSFAAHAASHGARSAFLAYADTAAVAMENGQYLNALAQWRQRPDSKILLQWGPQFAGASADGISGFTTGPYYMRHPGADTLWPLDNTPPSGHATHRANGSTASISASAFPGSCIPRRLQSL